MKSQSTMGRAQLIYVVCAFALASVTFISSAQAQPDIFNAPKAVNPTNRAVGRQLTAEERVQQRLRRQLQLLGVNQTATQDVLLAYVDSETKARQAVTDKGRELQRVLTANVVSNAQVAALLNDYQAAIEEDKVRRVKAQQELIKAVDVTKIPKVEATLILMGVYGEGPALGNLTTNAGRGRNAGAALAPRGNNVAQGAPRGFGQVTPDPNSPKPTQPNIKPPVAKPAQI
ncbi:hypothetical protein EON80_31490 [bacterium]|nr:MAG: hypothetical protein EON80_31490 [bacterium]